MEDKNYLLFMLSLISERNTEVFYKGSESEEIFKGIQTNEAATKYVIELLHSKKQKLEKIILLCTAEVLEQRFQNFDNLTTYEYYRNKTLSYLNSKGLEYNDALFEIIKYNPNENDDIDEILTPMEQLAQITATDNTYGKHLYIDFTSGMRNSALAIIFAARIMQSDGIVIEKILYSNLLRGIGVSRENPIKIEECTKTYDIFEYLAGHIENKLGLGVKTLEGYHKKYPKVRMNSLFKQADEMGKKIKTGQTSDIQSISDQGKNERQQEIKESEASGSYLAKKTTEILSKEANFSDISSDAVKINLVKKYLEKDDIVNAYNYIREYAVEILIDRDIITSTSNKKLVPAFVTNELMANYTYYKKSFLAYAKKAICELGKNLTAKPTTVLNEILELPLSHFVETEIFSKLSVDDFMTKEFNTKCKKDVEIQKTLMANSIKEIVLKGSQDIAEQIIFEVSKYNENIEKIKKLYLTLGFPFANVYNNRLYMGYDSVYKKTLSKAFETLDLLYENNIAINGNYILQKAFRHIDKEFAAYSEFIETVTTDDRLLEILFPMSYNSYNIQSKKYKPWEFSEFLQEFMPIFSDIKDTRNTIIHKKASMSANEIILKTKKIEELIDIISR